MGVESFSPYSDLGKVDLIIRSEDGKARTVRYADVKIVSGRRETDQVIWELENSFFMKTESFIIMAIRLPETNGIFQKHYFILKSKRFLEIAKKHELIVENDSWILSLPFVDLQILTNQIDGKLSSSLTKTLKRYFDKWDLFLKWKKKP